MALFSSFRKAIYFPLAIPAIISYFLVGRDARRKIHMDVEMYWTHRCGPINGKKYVSMWYSLLISAQEYRNVFYCRVGLIGRILPNFLKPVKSLFINPSLCNNYDGGLYIAHGTSSQLYANKIGKNLWMHHNVTLGMIGEGRPEIGDNVYIGTGAVVLGGIKIGNNVRIGANAIVIDDIPDNAVVVSPKARVVKIMKDPNCRHGNSRGNHDSIGGGKSLIFCDLYKAS